jgi:hypothetical protein
MRILCLPFRALLAVVDFLLRLLCDCMTPGFEQKLASGKKAEEVLLGQRHRLGIRRVSIVVTTLLSALVLTFAASLVAFPLLRHAAQTGEETTRASALGWLALWLPQGWLPGFADEAREELVRIAATDESEPLRRKAVALLQPHYPWTDLIVVELGGYLSSPSPEGRRRALEAMAAFAECSENRYGSLVAIARALKHLERTGARAELVPLLAARVSTEGLRILLTVPERDVFQLGLEVLIAGGDAKCAAAAEAALLGYPEGCGEFSEVLMELELIDTKPCQEVADRIHLRYPGAGHSILSLQDYLAEHPNGASAEVARRRIAALLQDDGPFVEARAEGTVEALESFVRGYPGHARRAEARQLARELLGRDFRELVAEGRLEVEFAGHDITEVAARIRRRAAETLKVRIPVGTYLVAKGADTQNMVVTEDVLCALEADEWIAVSVPVACASYSKGVPGKWDRFSAADSTESRELAMLMPELEDARAPYAVRQAAVWIVTDDADYGKLGQLVRRPSYETMGGTREICEPEMARAMQICDAAGIAIARKAIWADRDKILAGLEAGKLRDWLAARIGTTATPSSPSTR